MYNHISTILNKNWVKPASITVGAFVAGGVVGYILGKRNGDVFIVPAEALESEIFEETSDTLNIYDFEPMMTDITKEAHVEKVAITSAERATQKIEYNKIISKYDTNTPQDDDVIIERDKQDGDIITPDPTPIINVFADNDPYWNYEHELSTRTADEPYVIHVDEYVTNESGARQSCVTYYVGDDILADENDTPIHNYGAMLGELKFGHGSKDPNVVFIRNESMDMEWEVINHGGSFQLEVLGFDADREEAAAELKHSVRRFRDD